MIYRINEKFNNYSLIDFLNYFHLAKKKIHNLFMDKAISVNGKLASRNQTLKTGDELEIIYKEMVNYKPYKAKIKVLYEDDYLLIIDKPVGYLVHPDEVNTTRTVCNMVANYYLENNIFYTVKYIHRLDIETSGVLVFAKDMLTESFFNYCFSIHSFKRYYLLLASGNVKPDMGTIDAPIGEDRHHNQRRRVSKTGQEAITHYKVLKYYKHFSLCEALLETGRTHQIRVHFKYLGYPLVGDELYGGSLRHASRVMLHSYRFEFYHPLKDKDMVVEAKIPSDFKELME